MEQSNNKAEATQTPNAFLNIKNYSPSNLMNVIQATMSYITEEDYVKEQAEERMKACIDSNSRCIRQVINFDPNNEDKEIITPVFGKCEHCGCSAPYLFYAKQKTCKYPDNTIKWGPMLEKEEWEELKRVRLQTPIDNAEPDINTGYTDSESESTYNVPNEGGSSERGNNKGKEEYSSTFTVSKS
jgi:hypothetical protein